MSQGYRQEHRESQWQEPLAWERVEWRQGDGRYVFEVAKGGLHATLTSPHGRALTLPTVAWEGLLDALAAARKTKSRSERNLPARAGARWSEAETAELVKAFQAGGAIAQLARAHNRTQYAVEAHLDRLGLWDRLERRPTGEFRPPPDAGDGAALATYDPEGGFATAPATGRRERASGGGCGGVEQATPAAASNGRDHGDPPIPFTAERD